MRASVALALLALLAAPVFAQSPTDEQIPYQGVLSDAGTPLADGLKILQFTLSDAGGGSWTESANLPTTDGAFTHRLGSVETLTGIDFSLPVSITTTYTPTVGSPVTFGPTPLGAAPTARFAQTAGGVSFPLVGTAATAGSTLQITNTGPGDGLRIDNAGDDGIRVTTAGGDGLYVARAFSDGVEVDIVTQAGIKVRTAGTDGVLVEDAARDGFYVAAAGDDGIDIRTAAGSGVEIGTVGAHGIFVQEAGLWGLLVDVAGLRGLQVSHAGDIGVFVYRSGDTNADGTPDADKDGVLVAWAGGDGVQVSRANGYGIRSYGDDGNYLRNRLAATFSPDLILGGTSSSTTGDNAVLTTDPTYTSSDLFGISNDAIVFYIDNNDDADTGEFEVRRGDNTLLFRVLENGTITPLNGSYGGESAVRIDDPTAPSARTLTLPSVVSSERLVAFSGNVTTGADGSVVVRLPDYADAVAGDFRYQLTVIGSFAQAIVGEKVSGGQFVIRTSEPGVEVSWRVEGTRQDAWAAANAHADVSAKERAGTYIHPAAFGASPSLSADFTEDGPSQITADGQRRLDAEAAEQAEIEQSVADGRARRDQERQQEAARRATERTRDTERD